MSTDYSALKFFHTVSCFCFCVWLLLFFPAFTILLSVKICIIECYKLSFACVFDISWCLPDDGNQWVVGPLRSVYSHNSTAYFDQSVLFHILDHPRQYEARFIRAMLYRTKSCCLLYAVERCFVEVNQAISHCYTTCSLVSFYWLFLILSYETLLPSALQTHW